MANTGSLKLGIERAIEGIPYTFGVAVKYLESGAGIGINSDRAFPLASVFKVPVLVTAARQLDTGRLRLDQRVPFKDSMKTHPSGILPFLGEGLNLSVKDLLLLMIIISDNTATDMVIDRVGGIPQVASTMRELGFSEDQLDIRMTVRAMYEQVIGPGEPALRPSQMKALLERIPPETAPAPEAHLAENTGSPAAMNRLFEMIFLGTAASRSACDVALDILQQQTLNDRLPSQLPFGTDVAHKTGTAMSQLPVRNDSGIIYIGDRVHAAVTVLCQRTVPLTPEQMGGGAMRDEGFRVDKAMGAIGRLVFEHAADLG